ncbi:hypothetical protein M758_4G003700 [Ceratodon purpureus]|uniref:Uncharacterized protein n=2 Tax=Ceratodon purpureus TaxID=3225 RepID=A0A8T0I3U8_CERPU|nr:hypothetical protein KC19_4G004000 [Ceratodon purpureus]KAG0617628.1 hypothetical protein M758_4G003700 [Ceratodon purpureus]
MDLQTRGVLDLDTVFDSSRFDYEQWILQGPDAHGQDDGGSAAIHALVSSYNTFGGQHRSSSLEDEASMETSFSEQWWLGSGYGRVDSAAMEDLTYFCHSFDDVRCKDSCNISVHAEKPALEFSIDTYMYTEEELARLNDGRVTATDLFENFFENCEDDIADNCGIAEGITDLNGQTKVPKKRGGRRQKSHFMKRPMALAEVIFDLLDSEKRENSLRCLSGHLIERRETDLHFYRTAAYQLYFSCSTLAILIQEVLSVYERINTGDLNIRGSKRLANVLTCFQSIAASDETRFPFVRAKIPNLLQPIIFSTFTEEVYENVRAISLSVIDLTCKNCEREVIQWAVESDIVQACLHAIEIGSRLSKLEGQAAPLIARFLVLMVDSMLAATQRSLYWEWFKISRVALYFRSSDATLLCVSTRERWRWLRTTFPDNCRIVPFMNSSRFTHSFELCCINCCYALEKSIRIYRKYHPQIQRLSLLQARSARPLARKNDLLKIAKSGSFRPQNHHSLSRLLGRQDHSTCQVLFGPWI